MGVEADGAGKTDGSAKDVGGGLIGYGRVLSSKFCCETDKFCHKGSDRDHIAVSKEGNIRG